uniref:Nuclease HARBI1 n=1 Tax=Ciona intestinalis TaxID=7719 RepID=F6TS58_CIOIN
MFQLLVCLHFFATGHFQKSDGNLLMLDQSTVSRIVKRISGVIARHFGNSIRTPTATEVLKLKQQFYVVAGFPCVIRAIYCTHIPICYPGGLEAGQFPNRKGYFSIMCSVCV